MSLLSAIGLRPDGDPQGMRLFAASLRSAAQLIHAAGAGAAASVDAAMFVGPAGDATRARAGHMRTRTVTLADELGALADEIARRAHDLEHAQHGWDLLKKQAQQALDDLAGHP